MRCCGFWIGAGILSAPPSVRFPHYEVTVWRPLCRIYIASFTSAVLAYVCYIATYVKYTPTKVCTTSAALAYVRYIATYVKYTPTKVCTTSAALAYVCYIATYVKYTPTKVCKNSYICEIYPNQGIAHINSAEFINYLQSGNFFPFKP